MRKLFLTLIVTALPLSFAKADKPYGTGGCGLGSMLQGKHGNQVMAITTNETGTQTFAISSGTSNCVDSGVVKTGKEARAFIELNHLQLANDISRGRGETLSSLAGLYGCKDVGALGSVLQKNYDSIFADQKDSVDHIERSINKIIQTELAPTCIG